MSFNYLTITHRGPVATLWLNNAKKANCLNETLWFELGRAITQLSECSDTKVVVLRAKGKHFSSGIDFNFLKSIKTHCDGLEETAREAYLHQFITTMQESFSQFEQCKLPIIAMIHGACIGGAIDLISACDVRFATLRTAFSIMETKLGIVADMGTLQRARFLMSEARLRQLALSSELFNGYKARQYGLINRFFFTQRGLEKHVYRLAQRIASLPKDAVQDTKASLNYSRNVSIDQGLAHIARHNAIALQTLDIPEGKS